MRAQLAESPIGPDLIRIGDRAFLGRFVRGLADACRSRGIVFRVSAEFDVPGTTGGNEFLPLREGSG